MMQATTIAEVKDPGIVTTIGKYRWTICALLFFCNHHQLFRPPGAQPAVNRFI